MKILVTIDFSDVTHAVLQQAGLLARAMQAEIILLHVAEQNPDQLAYDFDPAAAYAIDPTEIRDNIAQKFHREHRDLQQQAEKLRNAGLECRALMIQGETVQTILAEAEKLAADFIVAGSHGKGVIGQILLGSVSKELISRSPVPVHLVPAQQESD